MSYTYPQAAVELRILPEDFKLSSDPVLQSQHRIIVQARNVTVNVNDYKTSDTFSVEIDYKSFPFDPRLIRACGVVIYIQDMEHLYNDDGSLNKIVPGASTRINPSVSNAVAIGFVDEESIEFDDSKRTVHFEGRDTTALLIDQKYTANKPIPLNTPIDVAIKNLLASFAATAAIEVSNPLGLEMPTLAKYYPDFGSPLAGQKNTGSHESYWEIIQDMCSRAGLICYMSTKQLSDKTLVPNLVLTTPRNRKDTKDDIKFIYGVNVKNLKLKRKIGRFKNFNIQVRSFNPIEKDVLIARIPEEAERSWGIAYGFEYNPAITSGPTATPSTTNFASVNIPVLKPDGSVDTSQVHVAPYITFNIPNISDKDQLIRIGQTVYEQYSMQQLEGSFDTFEMSGRTTSSGTGLSKYNTGKEYDLAHIVKQQTICLEIDTGDLASISRFSSPGLRAQYLEQRGYDRETANMFANIIGKFSPRFQLKSYSMTVNQDSGFKLSAQFHSVIDIGNIGLV